MQAISEVENPALFQERLVEALKKYTNIKTKSSVLLGTYFLSQSARDAMQITKLAVGPQTPMNELNEVFKVFNNRDQTEEDKRTQHGRRIIGNRLQ